MICPDFTGEAAEEAKEDATERKTRVSNHFGVQEQTQLKDISLTKTQIELYVSFFNSRS